MAQHKARPGRRLIIFALLIAALYAGVALGDHDPGTKGYQFGGVWQPKLGLDLQGGTRITLEASTSTGQAVTPANLEEARTIIDQRVNGSGVSEGSVATQGGRNIVVEVPGKEAGSLVNSVKQTAQLRFRLVSLIGAGQPTPTASPSASPSASSGASSGASPGGSTSGSPSAKASSKPSSKPSASSKAKIAPSPSASPRGRALSSGLTGLDATPAAAKATTTPKPTAAASAKAKAKAKATASGTATSTASPQATASPSAASPTTTKGAPIGNQLAWMDDPGAAWTAKFVKFTCPADGSARKVTDNPKQPLLTCDSDGNKLLLSTAMIEGTQLKSANAGAPDQNNPQWTVNLTFDGTARKTFATVTQTIANQTSALTGQQKMFAIVLDGQVISAPTVEGVINNGQAQITGSFTQQQAQSLATSLKYGALPLRFKVPVVSIEGPTLASNQLSAGLIAGGIGLLLVLVYCLLYYRGLGLVVLASLVIAGVVTYAVVLAMSSAVGFTLTLPGIAGLIVAVGITADSFIVYFERIRDEMRNGKSMRVAVEAGWVRARATCLAADAVSLLAAVVLYIFSIGVVKGFAFTLGISTVIDLIVFFLFTKPMVSWLATFRFFYSGHKMSGLSPDHVGSNQPVRRRPATLGGRA